MSHSQVRSAIDGVPSRSAAGTPSRLPGAVIDAALADLEFQEVLGAVAGFAAGPLGAARVRERRPTAALDWIREELALVGEVAAVFRRGDKLVAEPVPDLGRALARLRVDGSVLELTELRDLRIVLSASRLVEAELRRVTDQAPRAAALAVPLPDKAIDRRLELSVGDDGELLDTASPALAAARREIQVARQRLVRKLEGILRGLDAQATIKDAGVTMRGGRYVIPVRRDSRSRPGGIVHDESASAGTLFVEPSDAVEMGNAYREAQAEEEREVLRVLRELTAILRPARDVLADALEMCVRVDDLVARARYAVAVLGEVPEVVDAGGAVQLLDARHPLLLARGVVVIPFSLEMHGNERTLLISGPNTGGKTVMLKTTALVALLAQSGIVPPAGGGTAVPIFTQVFTDIGDRQSLAESLSTFSGHLASLRTMLAKADSGTLVLLDEVGSGTDPAEGAALAAAVLLELTRRGSKAAPASPSRSSPREPHSRRDHRAGSAWPPRGPGGRRPSPSPTAPSREQPGSRPARTASPGAPQRPTRVPSSRPCDAPAPLPVLRRAQAGCRAGAPRPRRGPRHRRERLNQDRVSGLWINRRICQECPSGSDRWD